MTLSTGVPVGLSTPTTSKGCSSCLCAGTPSSMFMPWVITNLAPSLPSRVLRATNAPTTASPNSSEKNRPSANWSFLPGR